MDGYGLEHSIFIRFFSFSFKIYFINGFVASEITRKSITKAGTFLKNSLLWDYAETLFCTEPGTFYCARGEGSIKVIKK